MFGAHTYPSSNIFISFTLGGGAAVSRRHCSSANDNVWSAASCGPLINGGVDGLNGVFAYDAELFDEAIVEVVVLFCFTIVLFAEH